MERLESWITVDGHRMRYMRAGSGPPLLLLHGLLGYAFSWRRNEESLGRSAALHEVDLLGMGESDRPRGLDHGLRAQARRMLRVMDELSLASADVLGTSHGGALALMMAALAAEEGRPRVERLILAAPANPWSKHGKFFSRVLGSPPLRWLLPAPMRWLAPLFGGYFLARQYGDRKRIPPGTVEGYVRPMLVPGSFEYGLDILRTLRRDLREMATLLPRIAHLPTLFLWGSRDPIVLPESIVPLRACFHRSELVMIEGAGHLPYEETPEEFNRAVNRFLAGTLQVA